VERYIVRQGDTLVKIAARFGVTLKELASVNRKIKNLDKIYVGQFVNLPIQATHPVGSPLGPTLQDVFGQGALSIAGDPAEDPRFVQNTIVAVGILIWGGDFALYRKVINNQPSDPIMLPRNQVSLVDDPLKSSYVALRSLYSERKYADAALAASKLPNAFTYYVGEGGIIFPTVISDTTAPALCDALRKARENERRDANAAANLARDLLFWYVGARFPMKIGGGAGEAVPAAAADTALVGFSASERAIIAEAKQMLASPEMMQIRQAQGLGQEITLKIGGRLVQYEPAMPFSGITNFEGNGFTMGREAFSSESELTKTVLHELYRLTTSVARGSAGGGLNNAETAAAFQFADRAAQAISSVPK
jgi:LysM repeat protein